MAVEFEQSLDILLLVCDSRWTSNTHNHQHWRCVGITASSSQMQRRDQPARIARRVSLAAARPNGTGRCARGQEDRAARAWVEPRMGEGEWNGKGRRRDGRRGGGRAGIYGRREKRRGSAARAFPNRAAAKLKGADRTTEITLITLINIVYFIVLL
jgi:hypothetical protein